MAQGNCYDNIRKAIFSVCALNEKAIASLIEVFSPAILNKDDYLCRAGDYPMHLAYICKGIFRSFYKNLQEQEFDKGFYIDHMFVLPLPSFIYRKPSFLNLQAIVTTEILKAKFSAIQNLSEKDPAIKKFMRLLIDREWIVKKELHEASKYIYNAQTRYQLFHSKYAEYIKLIPSCYIASLLHMSEKQLSKFTSKYN